MSSATALSAPVSPGRARFGLLVLTLINLFNYLDRFVVAIVLPKIQDDFGLTNEEAGRLGTAFVVALLLGSPLAGYLGDRLPRRLLIALSVVLWSLATGASGLASSFVALLIARAVIGIGEAGYGAVAPSLISDLFARELRTRMLAFFYVAIPVGSALGFALGGWLSDRYSWQVAFYVAGFPGVALAALAFLIREPPRGAMDGPAAEKLPFRVGLRGLARNPPYWTVTAGYTLITFAIGGLGYWMPTFLVRERGLSAADAGLAFGALTATAGLLGTLVGGWVGDRMDRRSEGGALRVTSFGLLAAAPCMYLAVTLHTPLAIYAAIFFAQLFLWLHSGPVNAAIVNCVPPAFRAFAMGFNVLVIHLLGDAWSPPLIGAVADRSSLATAIGLNALPVLAAGATLFVAGRLFQQRFAEPRPALSPQ